MQRAFARRARQREGIGVGDRGYISQTQASELGRRGGQLVTGIQKNRRNWLPPFHVACLQARQRIEELFACLK